MGKKLIIAEKPSLARSIVTAIKDDSMKACDGYYEGSEYVVTYVFGHLFEAYDIEDYTKGDPTWVLDILPFCPENNKFSFKLKTAKNKEGKKQTDPGVKKQYLIIKTLIDRPDIDTLINAGDSDREGEALIRLIIRNADTNNPQKPVKRLWLPEQTPAQIRYGLKHLSEASAHDNLANEGFSRLYMDWLYGINLTRFITLKCEAPKGITLRVGRVLAAIVDAVYERDMAIRNFVPIPYFTCVSEEINAGKKLTLKSRETFEENKYIDAVSYCTALNEAGATVIDVKKEKKTLHPKKLFSTTSLQSAMSQAYNMTPDECMACTQRLYESGYISYPRTDTEYIGESEKGKISKVIDTLNGHGYELEFKDKKSIFDNSKIVSHSAITPTYKYPKDLKERDKLVYDVIVGRFAAVFCKEPLTVNRSTIVIQCGNEQFKLKGDILITEGYLKYDITCKKKEKELPDLKVGDSVEINFMPRNTQTSPPPHYSITTLNNFLENPFRNFTFTEDEEENDAVDNDTFTELTDDSFNDSDDYKQLLEGVSIGTGATRAEILKKAIDNRYIGLKNKTYTIEPLGIYLIESMHSLGINISAEKTVEMSKTLKRVYNGVISIDESINITMEDIHSMFEQRNKPITTLASAGIRFKGSYDDTPIGACPICGASVKENKIGYSCENNKKEDGTCRFILFKQDKYIMSVTNRQLTRSMVHALLKKGECTTKGYSQKKKSTYPIIISLGIEEGKTKWSSRFVTNEDRESLGNCPICGGNVYEFTSGFSCENNKKENGTCKFILFKEDRFIKKITKKNLNKTQVKGLLSSGKCKAKTFKKDNPSISYPIWLILDIVDGKTQWSADFYN